MKPPGARPSCRWRWPALAIAMALLATTWRPTSAPPQDERSALDATPTPRDAPLAHSAACIDCRAAGPSHRSSGRVHALAQCGACHLPEARGDASSPMLARWNVEQPRLPPRAPAAIDDETPVRAGGEVYLQACTRCHERERQAVLDDEPRRLAVSIGDGAPRERAAAALDASLSGERMAALAAFLRRHAGALPGMDAARSAQDARL